MVRAFAAPRALSSAAALYLTRPARHARDCAAVHRVIRPISGEPISTGLYQNRGGVIEAGRCWQILSEPLFSFGIDLAH